MPLLLGYSAGWRCFRGPRRTGPLITMTDQGSVDQALDRWFTAAVDSLDALGGSGLALALALRGGTGAFRGGELDLAQANRLGRHLDAFVVADELQRLLERERAGRDQADQVVRAGSSHVGQLLRLRGVDVEVIATRALADDHALVELVGRRNEERAALLEVLDREPGRLAAAVGD